MQVTAVQFLILWTGFLGMFWGAIQFLVLRRSMYNSMLCFFYICIGIVQVYLGFMTSGFLLQHPHLAMIHLPFLYFFAPLLHAFFRFIAQEEHQYRMKDIVHLIPGAIIIILLIPLYIQDVETKRTFLKSPASIYQQSGISITYPMVLGMILVAIFLYMAFYLKNNTFIWNRKYLVKKNIFYITYASIMIVIILLLFFIFGFLFFNIFISDHATYLKFIETWSVFLSIAILLYFGTIIRYPYYFRKLQFEYQTIRYEQSRIEGIDLDRVLDKLLHLMDMEKLFCDEDLNMTRLSKELAITSHQLSQIVNEKFKKNFNTFINEYRIREAEEMLLQDAERSITSIAYAVGFNTISVFYKWFYKITGYSPGELRNRKNGK